MNETIRDVRLEQEHDWLRRARMLDETALAAIFDAYYLPLYRYIYHHVGHQQTAEDLTAKVFHRLLHALSQGNGPERYLKAWLYRVAANLVIDDARRQQHRNHEPLAGHAITDGLNIEELSDTALLAAQADAALQRLTPKQRDVIVLRYLADFSLDEIAHYLDMSIGAVKALQHRALAALRRELAGERRKETDHE